MDHMPLLPSSNCFACLSIESFNIVPSLDSSTCKLVETSAAILPPLPPMFAKAPPPPQVHIPSWECYLPCKYTVASTPSATSLSLEVELKTTDMQHMQQVQALLDSGATGLFMDVTFVEKHQLTTHPLM